jgi:hypothetical protein
VAWKDIFRTLYTSGYFVDGFLIDSYWTALVAGKLQEARICVGRENDAVACGITLSTSHGSSTC